MNSRKQPLDSDSKRWIAVVTAAALISVIYIGVGFTKVFFPSKTSTVVIAQPTPVPSRTELRRETEPTWNFPESESKVDTDMKRPTAEQASSIQSTRSAAKQNQDAAFNEALVHRQAEMFRTMVKQNNLPGGLGNLSVEEINEMEKNGIGVW